MGTSIIHFEPPAGVVFFVPVISRLPRRIAMFEEKFGDDAHVQIADRTKQALDSIPKTLQAIKRIAESSTDAGEAPGS